MTTLFFDCDGGVVTSGGLVIASGTDMTVPATARRVACGEAIVRPGAIDAHTHLYSGLAPLGMPAPREAPKSFVEILERVWWRLDRALDEASLRASAELYVAEALLSGTTTIIDHHESPGFVDGSLDVLAEAAQALGCRLVTCFGATDRNGGPEEGRRGLRECERFVRRNTRPLVRGMIGLHASFTCGDETVRAAGELARELDVPVHVHLAEDRADVDDARSRGHAGPLERLLALRALPRGSILAHGVALTEDQARAASEAGLWLVHNPRSNANNRVGYAASLTASEHVALGTDGYPADMRAERLALLEHALAECKPLAGDRLAARVEGGFAIASERFGARFGAKIARGLVADVAIWRSGCDAITPGAPPLHVMVDGRLVVEQGQLVYGDLDAIRARAREQAPRLFSRMQALP